MRATLSLASLKPQAPKFPTTGSEVFDRLVGQASVVSLALKRSGAVIRRKRRRRPGNGCVKGKADAVRTDPSDKTGMTSIGCGIRGRWFHGEI
jgi:hypothetical protein